MARRRKLELTDEEAKHLQRNQYGSFKLTDAIRPTFGTPIVPEEGYRRGIYFDEPTGQQVPVLVAAASEEKLLALFYDLLDPFGNEYVSVVLESTHNSQQDDKRSYQYHDIDRVFLPALLDGFDELLLQDGNMGIAVYNEEIGREVQFDEHKLLIVYAEDLEPFAQVCEEHGVPENPLMSFLTEGEHVHSSADEYFQRFRELRGVFRDR